MHEAIIHAAKDAVIAVGGYSTSTVGEDMELIVRLHRLLVEKGRAYRITYLPDPICWTQAPEDWRTLRNQRVRWQRGLCESLWSNKGLMRSRSVAGWLAFPYFVLFEWAAPLVEMSGYLLFVVLLASDSVRWPVSGLFLLIALAFGILLTTVALTLDEISFHVYPRGRNLFELFLTGIVENFGYRQINVVWRLTGMWRWVRGTQAQWGVMQRKGLEQPTRKP